MFGKMRRNMTREDASSDDAGAPESRQLQMEGGRQSREQATASRIQTYNPKREVPPQKRGAQAGRDIARRT